MRHASALLLAVIMAACGGDTSVSAPAASLPSSPPPEGISRDEAADAARAVLPEGEWQIGVNRAGPLGHIYPSWEEYDFVGDLSAETWVWRVFLVRGDRGADVIIDFVDGSVYGVVEWILD